MVNYRQPCFVFFKNICTIWLSYNIIASKIIGFTENEERCVHVWYISVLMGLTHIKSMLLRYTVETSQLICRNSCAQVFPKIAGRGVFRTLSNIRKRSSRCSVEKVFLEISQNSQENACARVSFLIKLQAFGPSGLQLS